MVRRLTGREAEDSGGSLGGKKDDNEDNIELQHHVLAFRYQFQAISKAKR